MSSILENQEYDDYKVGGQDKFGNEIEKIFINCKGSYIIYKCKDSNDLSFEGNDEAHSNYSKIAGHIANITSKFNSEFEKYNFLKEQVVYAMVESIEGDKLEAEKILNGLEERIVDLKKKEGKLYYLGGAFSLTLINIIISVVFIVNHNLIKDNLIKECIFIFYVIAAGSLGGVLSIAININKFEIDSYKSINFITGISRTLIAMIGGFFIYFAAKSNIIIGFSHDSAYGKYLIIVLGMISGFSETFVPNIMSKVQTEKEKVSSSKASM